MGTVQAVHRWRGAAVLPSPEKLRQWILDLGENALFSIVIVRNCLLKGCKIELQGVKLTAWSAIASHEGDPRVCFTRGFWPDARVGVER